MTRVFRLVAVLSVLLAAVGVSVVRPGVAWASGGELVGPIPGKNWASYSAKVGAGGRVVAFATWLRNFDSSAPLPLVGVYVRDRVAQTSESMVRPFGGGLPDGNSYPLGVSPEAGTRYVLYSSVASNVVSGDANGNSDVFLFDRVALTTERVSVGVGGVEGNGGTIRAAMSGNTAVDGTPPRYVAFVSSSSNLVAGDTNGKSDVFLRDRVAGTTTLVSRGVGGVPADGDSFDVSVSDNGRYVAFSSAASNVVAGDANGSSDVFVRDMVAGTTERVSVGFVGEASGSSSSPQISADGRFVAFDSDADDLVSGDDNLSYDVFVRDRLSGSTERVSVGPSGQQGEDDSESPSMSRDGRYIAFDSDAEEFSDLDGNISTDVYVRDRLARNTARASEKANGLDAFSDATGGSISPEGRFVGFDTDSSDYKEATDTNDDYDVYLKDMGTPFYGNPTIGNRFNGVAPKRLLDTRLNGTKLTGPTTRDLTVTGGTTGVPSDAQAVVLNVTSTEATTAAGYVTVGPTGSLDTGTSSLNLQPGATVPNLVTVKVGTGGKVSLYTNTGSVHLIVDVFGYYKPDDGDAFTGIQPDRILDTRGPDVPALWPSGQPFVGGTGFGQMDLPVAGVGDVPADARSVVLNITSTQASTANGYVTVGPTGNLNIGTSNLNLQPGYNVPNLAVVKVGAGGKVSLYTNTGSVHLIVDVVGYYGPFGDDLFFPLSPGRILDTRDIATNSLVPELSPLGPGATADLPVAGNGPVPANARAVVMNVTSTQATSNGGYTTVWPTGTLQPLASSLNYRVGVNVPNLVQVKLGDDSVSVANAGKVSLYNGAGSVQLIADVGGYFR